MIASLATSLDQYRANAYGVHNYHPYPAKFIPQIPRTVLESYSQPGDFVLDPFCGSGTSLVEALATGRHAVGCDVNPLACLISRVKTHPLDADSARRVEWFLSAFERGWASCASGDPPNILNLSKWFVESVVRELVAIRNATAEVDDSRERDFLCVAFSAIIVRASNQESETTYRSVQKEERPGSVIEAFIRKARDMLSRNGHLAGTSARAEIVNEDATSHAWGGRKFNLIITSPPYVNSFDYYLYHKHRLAWLGFDHAPVQKREIGSRNKHNDQGLSADHYESALRDHLTQIAPHLARSARYVCVIGDGVIRGELIEADSLFDRAARAAGLRKLDAARFAQRRYTRGFNTKFRMNEKNTHLLVYGAE